MCSFQAQAKILQMSPGLVVLLITSKLSSLIKCGLLLYSVCVCFLVCPDPVSDAGVQHHREQGHPAADHLHPGEHPGGPPHVRAALRPAERAQRTGELLLQHTHTHSTL